MTLLYLAEQFILRRHYLRFPDSAPLAAFEVRLMARKLIAEGWGE